MVSRTPVTVPIISKQTGQVVGQAEGALIEYVYSTDNLPFSPETRSYLFVAITENYGIAMGVEGTADELESEETPEVFVKNKVILFCPEICGLVSAYFLPLYFGIFSTNSGLGLLLCGMSV